MVVTFRSILKFFEYLCLAIIAWVGLALDMNPQEHDLLATAIESSQRWAAIIIIVGAISVGLLRLLAYCVQEDSLEAKIIRGLIEEELEKLRDASFPDLLTGEPPDNNRITIFERIIWHWRIWPWRGVWPWGTRFPGSGWLVARYRSGHTTQNTHACFLAPDDADVRAEGVAGQTWRKYAAYRVRNLPNLKGIKYRCWYHRYPLVFLGKMRGFQENSRNYIDDKKIVAEYAGSTGLSESQVWQRIKCRKKCPLSICGVPIENSKGRVWGVLILDSSNGVESVDTNDKKFKERLRLVVKLLHKLEITA